VSRSETLRQALAQGWQLSEERPGIFYWRDRNGAVHIESRSHDDALERMAQHLRIRPRKGGLGCGSLREVTKVESEETTMCQR
jgi:hypothetical protein